VGHDTFDYVQLFVQSLGVLVALVGLGGVVLSLKWNREQQRIQNGPYVRVDIGLTKGIPDQKDIKNDVYYEDSSQLIDLTRGTSPSTELSAWFRNYQQNALGFALGVRASFLIQGDTAHQTDVEIPYVEYGKTVRIGLATIPTEGDITAMLISLSFHDFYDQTHTHIYGQKSSNALHGRLVWLRSDSEDESTPEGRSRGEGVDYNVGAVPWR
jgi:hypothetical protein